MEFEDAKLKEGKARCAVEDVTALGSIVAPKGAAEPPPEDDCPKLEGAAGRRFPFAVAILESQGAAVRFASPGGGRAPEVYISKQNSTSHHHSLSRRQLRSRGLPRRTALIARHLLFNIQTGILAPLNQRLAFRHRSLVSPSGRCTRNLAFELTSHAAGLLSPTIGEGDVETIQRYEILAKRGGMDERCGLRRNRCSAEVAMRWDCER